MQKVKRGVQILSKASLDSSLWNFTGTVGSNNSFKRFVLMIIHRCFTWLQSTGCESHTNNAKSSNHQKSVTHHDLYGKIYVIYDSSLMFSGFSSLPPILIIYTVLSDKRRMRTKGYGTTKNTFVIFWRRKSTVCLYVCVSAGCCWFWQQAHTRPCHGWSFSRRLHFLRTHAL